MTIFDPYNYDCESGACPRVTTNQQTGTVTISEDTTPGQQVVTTTAGWGVYLELVRKAERDRIAAGLRAEAHGAAIVGDWTRHGHLKLTVDIIERGDFINPVADDELPGMWESADFSGGQTDG